MNAFAGLCCSVAVANAQQWTQVGQDILGDEGHLFGRSVVLSGDGMVIATAVLLPTERSGVNIFKLTADSWSTVHSFESGTEPLNPVSLAMSTNGQILVVGNPSDDGCGSDETIAICGKITRLDSQTRADWNNGTVLQETQAKYNFGEAVAVSSDGETLVTSAPFASYEDMNYKRGMVKVYHASSFKTAMSTFTPTGYQNLYGMSVALSGDGSTLVIGSPGSNDQIAGFVEIHTKNSTNDWSLQQTIVAGAGTDAENWRFGEAVAISTDGTTIAIGCPSYDQSGIVSPKGQVTIYAFEQTQWARKGDSINGTTFGDYLGSALALSEDGATIAIGAPGCFFAGLCPNIVNTSGYVRVHRFNASAAVKWPQIGQTLMGDSAYGASVALTSSGNTVAIGAPAHVSSDEDDYLWANYDAGLVKVYSLPR